MPIASLIEGERGRELGRECRGGGEQEQGLCVILHKQNLCQTQDLIASTVNCVQSNLSVNPGCRERKKMVKGGMMERWNGKEEVEKGDFLLLYTGLDSEAVAVC